MKTIQRIFISLLPLVCFLSPVSGVEKMQVAEAVEQGLVEAVINGRGGHWGSCINIHLKNLTIRDLQLKLTAGRMLIPADTSVQKMVISNSQFIQLEGKQEKLVVADAFCAERFKAAPGIETRFAIGEFAEGHLYALIKFMDESGYHQTIAGQDAVWSVTDDQPIEFIYDEEQRIAEDLREFVARLKRKEIPWYSLIRSKEKPFPAVNEVVKVKGNVEYYVMHSSSVRILLTDKKGKIVKYLTDLVPHHPGKHGYYFEMDVKDMPKDQYFAVVEIDHQVKKKLLLDLSK